MIYEILKIFKEHYEREGDRLVLDNYHLKEGLYVKIKKDETIEYYIFKNNKNEKIKDYCLKDLNGNIRTAAYQWFKERDYYSGYLNSNKAFSDKKIHNINYLSLFVKLESFVTLDPKKRLPSDAIEKQFNGLKTYDKFNKPKEKAILKLFREDLNAKDRLEDIDRKYSFITRNIDKIIAIAKEHGVTNYIKLFFDEDIEKYKKESSYYYAIKIFNDISLSENIDGEVFGPPDSNFGLNSKKPFLISKTKWSKTPPFMVTDKDALMLKRFFDWLDNQDYNNHFSLSKELFFDKAFVKNNITLTDFDYIPTKIGSDINRLPKPIYFKNHLLLKKNKQIIEDTTINFLWELEQHVHETFYNSQLTPNYFGEVYNKLDGHFQSFIYMTRDAMVNYFEKRDPKGFYQVIKKYGTKFILEHIRKERLFKACLSLNLKLSLMEHTGENIMNIKMMQENMTKKLEESNYNDLTSEEFFFLTGQVARYLLDQSEKSDKRGEMLEPYLRASKTEKLKHAIQADYFKYKHKISLHYIRFNNALSLIMSYNGDEKLSSHMDTFLIGALSNNIFYMKNED